MGNQQIFFSTAADSSKLQSADPPFVDSPRKRVYSVLDFFIVSFFFSNQEKAKKKSTQQKFKCTSISVSAHLNPGDLFLVEPEILLSDLDFYLAYFCSPFPTKKKRRAEALRRL